VGRPTATQDSLPDGWPAFPGGTGYPLGSNERFQVDSIPLSQASPGAPKSYYKDPRESLIGATFHPKIANPGFFDDFLREIIACNADARRQAVKTGRISRNKPGV
jgi:hypothetical protein